MGKNSVRSKGYRKAQKKTNGYTDSEKKVMIIGFLVIAVVLVCVLWVPDWIESFSLLKVKDGVVQGVEDNGLVCNMGTSSNPKYRKLAVVEAPEGFEMTGTDYISDSNMPYLIFEPTGDAAAQTLMAQSGNGEAESLANSYASNIGVYGEILYQGEMIEETIDDKHVWGFVAEYRMEDFTEQIADAEAEDDASEDADAEDADAEEKEPVYSYTQSAILYVDSPIDGKSVVLTASNTGDSEDAFGDRDALMELVRSAVPGVELSK